MADVSFTLNTFGRKLTRSMRANVIFTPSNDAAMGPDGIHIGRVVVPFSDINPETGVGVADLVPTSFLRPSTHYIVSIEWLAGVPSGWAEINWPLQVPTAGGALSDLLQIPWPLGALAIGPIRPTETVAINGLWVDNSREPARLMQRTGPTTWIEVAVLGALGDPAAANLILNDTLTRAAVDSRVQGIAAEIIASDGTIIAAAQDAVGDALEEVGVVTSTPKSTGKDITDHGMLMDANGNVTDVGFDIYGQLSTTTVRSGVEKGMLRAVPSEDGSTIDFVDDRGRKYGLGLDAVTGEFSERTIMLLQNQLNALIIGGKRPQQLPGHQVVWDQTDPDGNVIGRHVGRDDS